MMAAASPLWFACSVLAVVASANLLACSVRKSVAVMAWLAALTFALWLPSGGPTHSVGPTPLWTGPGRPESSRRSERLGPGPMGNAALEGWSVAASLFWSPW